MENEKLAPIPILLPSLKVTGLETILPILSADFLVCLESKGPFWNIIYQSPNPKLVTSRQISGRQAQESLVKLLVGSTYKKINESFKIDPLHVNKELGRKIMSFIVFNLLAGQMK